MTIDAEITNESQSEDWFIIITNIHNQISIDLACYFTSIKDM